jgi:hypothetical protein
MGRWSLALILLLAAPSSLRAQEKSPRLELSMPPQIAAGVDAPLVSLANMLSEGNRRELLSAGWPTVLHCRVELWKRSQIIFFDRESFVEWDLTVEYTPATQLYHVWRQQEGKVDDLGQFPTIEEAEQIVDRPYRVPLSPKKSGARYYYAFSLDQSTLSGNDLDAWQRWVRGDAKPAIRGDSSRITAIQRGVGSLLSRVLGGETQHYERRSATFPAG